MISSYTYVIVYLNLSTCYCYNNRKATEQHKVYSKGKRVISSLLRRQQSDFKVYSEGNGVT